jgi:hypothetical protein
VDEGSSASELSKFELGLAKAKAMDSEFDQEFESEFGDAAADDSVAG